MASSVVMQSILASPATPATINRTRPDLIVPVKYGFAPFPSRTTSRLQLRCMAKDGKKEESSPAAINSAPEPTPFKPPTPKASTSVFDLLAFSGPAPERINGRLAMIGFVAAMAVEVSNGQDVFSQISNGGIPWFLGTSVLLTLASLVPLFKGVSVQSKSGGLMTSDAEMWNGRFAMLGLVALAFTEYLKGSALV